MFCSGLGDQHHVPNVPCDRADQAIFLFPHLTYFHKLNAKAAAKLIRALITHRSPSEPLFHCNETIVVFDPTATPQPASKSKRSKKAVEKNDEFSDPLGDFSTHVSVPRYRRLIGTYHSSSTRIFSMLSKRRCRQIPMIVRPKCTHSS